MPINLTLFIHFVAYYLAWISCIFFASRNEPYTGPIIALILLTLQVLWQTTHKQPWWPALFFALCLTVVGSITDTFWMKHDFIYFKANPFYPHFTAPWMICLWLGFGFNTILISEKFIHHYFICGVLTFFFLPLAYWLGIKIGAAQLTNTPWFYLYLGVLWAILLPWFFYIYKGKS